MNTEEGKRLVTVCAACKRASCWAGNFMCVKAVGAGTMQLSVNELLALDREHPRHFSAVEPEVKEPTCGTCRFFKLVSEPLGGFCRRRAPSIVNSFKAYFPIVSDGDWCGEYEKVKK